MAKWVNTVPQGVIGTGNATVFNNPVAAQFGNQLAGLRQREQQQALLQQKEAEKLAQSWKDNQLKTSGGLLWADQIAKIEQDYFNEGAALKQRAIDPWGTSNDGLGYRAKGLGVKSRQDFRKAMETKAIDTEKYIRNNFDKLKPEDIKAYHDFWENTTLEDAYSKNLLPPEIRNRFNREDALKGIKAITKTTGYTKDGIKYKKTDVDNLATRNSLLGAYARGGEEAQADLSKITSGVPVQELDSFSTNFDENRARIAEEIKGNPVMLKQLAGYNKLPNSSSMDEVVNNIANFQTKAKRNFDNEMGALIAASAQGVKLEDIEDLDFREANYNERVRSNNLREQEARNKKSEGVTPSDYEVERIELRTDERRGDDGKLIPNSSKIAADFPKSVKVRSVAFPSTQIKSALDVRTGKKGFLDAKNDLKLARLGYVKTNAKDGRYEVKAVVVDSNDDSYIVQLGEIPIDIRKGKAYISAMKALGSPPSSNKPATNTPKVQDLRTKYNY